MRKIKIGRSILFILFMAFTFRIILSPYGTLTIDQNTFIAWSNRLLEVGLGKFYFGSWSDYLPGYLYVLNLLAQIARTNTIATTTLYKLPAILSDIGTGYLIYRIVRKLKTEKWGIIAASLYLFNPAVIANSTLWGQVDGLTAFFSLLALWALDINPYISAFALAYGTIIKPQAALVSLVILFVMVNRKWNLKRIFVYVLSSFTFFVGLFIPFSNGNNLVNFISERLSQTLNQYPYTSVNAFNFWAIIGTWKSDTIFNIVGGLIVLILFGLVGVKFLKQKGGEYILLAFTYALSFMFMTRMHERHLLPAIAPLTVAVAINPVYIFALIGFSFIYVTNLYWAWIWVTNHFEQIFSDSIIKILSSVNVLLLAIFIVPERISDKFSHFEDSFLRSRIHTSPVISSSGNTKKNDFDNLKISSQTIKILFIGVVIFAAVTRFYNLGSPSSHYFDEVYHAFTAQNMMKGNTAAWEWWNTNPTGFAYEWTHPPLAKEGMVLGMLTLGESSFGWRFPGALLGVGSVILIYFITKEIFDDELISLIAAFIFSLDGLALVLSRIGMNDSYMLFFSLATILSYLKKKNLFAAIFFGLALSSKWSALWVAPIIFVAHFVLKRKLKWSYILFFIIPPLIYVTSYFPIFTNKQIQNEYVINSRYEIKTDKVGIIPLDMFIDTQKQMWWYHTRLKATHPYSSMWYTWPLMVRPIYLYTSEEIEGTVSRIYAMGNPFIFWGGVVSIFTATYFAIKERNKKLGLVIFAYLVFFTPWALSPRIMFLYHYLPSIPFMAIVTAYLLRRNRELIVPFLVLSLVVFIYFYPHFAGLKVPLSIDTSYYWFTSWR